MESAIEALEAKGREAKGVSRKLAYLSTEVKNKALSGIAEKLLARREEILTANEIDLKEALRNGAGSQELKKLIQQAVAIKRERHNLNQGATPTKPMPQIGG